MKIALAVNSAWNIYNFRLKLLKSLQDLGYEIHLIAQEDEYAARLVEEGFVFHPVRMSAKGVNPVEDIKLYIQFKKLYKTINPAVILQFTIKPNIYGSSAAASLGIPVINNVTGLGTAFIRPGIVNRVVRMLYRFSFRKSFVFFQNTDDLNLFVDLKLLRKEQTHLIPGSGVDVERFKPSDVSRKPSEIFLMIARILVDKGVSEYLQAAGKIRKKYPSAEFRLIGAFDEVSDFGIKRSVVEAAVQAGDIVYKEFTDTIAKEIHEADAVVLPSYREGTPRTLLEAAACGKPLITTEAPGCKDLVTEGINGFKCLPKDVDTLAGAIEKFILLDADKRRLMGRESRKMTEEKYDEKLVIEAYKKAIKEVTDNRNR